MIEESRCASKTAGCGCGVDGVICARDVLTAKESARPGYRSKIGR